jgi:hypothetical protein
MMRCPKTLTAEAKDFFKKHAPRCEAEGTLTEGTFDAFVLLCRTYQLLATLDPLEDPRTGIMKWVALCKNFERQGIPFGITAKKKSEKPKDLAAIIRDL